MLFLGQWLVLYLLLRLVYNKMCLLVVSSIVRSFFRNPSNVFVYICDIGDRHQAACDRKFKIWFRGMLLWMIWNWFQKL